MLCTNLSSTARIELKRTLFLLKPPSSSRHFMEPHRPWAVNSQYTHNDINYNYRTRLVPVNNDSPPSHSTSSSSSSPASSVMHAVHHAPYPLPSIMHQHPHQHMTPYHSHHHTGAPSRRPTSDSRGSASPLPPPHHQSANHPDVFFAPNANMLYNHANVMAAAAAAAAAGNGNGTAHLHQVSPSDPLLFSSGANAHASGNTPTRLPPILQVEKQQVTTSATQAASASRRRNEAHFVCPVPGCGSTFTRRFNLRGKHLFSFSRSLVTLRLSLTCPASRPCFAWVP